MPRPYLPIAAAVAAGLLLGGGIGAAKWRGSASQFHREARMAAILDQIEQVGPGAMLVIGDSITERNHFDQLCGRPAINAGISWSTSQDWLADGPRLVTAARPSIVILALGTNDGPGWQAHYRQLVESTRPAFAVAPADPDRAAFVASILPAVAGPRQLQDGLHPDKAGAQAWRTAIDAECTRRK